MLEPGRSDLEAVGTGIEMGEDIIARAGADGRLVQVRRGLRQLNLRMGYSRARGVEHAPPEVSRDLGKGRSAE